LAVVLEKLTQDGLLLCIELGAFEPAS